MTASQLTATAPAPAAVAAPPRRFAMIDTMRAFAALSVVAFHTSYSFPTAGIGLQGELAQREMAGPIAGVVLFFVISGFVLYRPFVAARFAGEPRPRTGPYAIRRVARIVPAYWLALIVATLWIGLPEVESVDGVLKYFGFAQVYGTETRAIGGLPVAWSLCVEVTFYISLPVIAWIMRRTGSRPGAILRSELGLCSALALIALVWQGYWVGQIGSAKINGFTGVQLLLMDLPAEANLFAAGMLLAILSVAFSRRTAPTRFERVIERWPWLPILLAIAVFATLEPMTHIQSYAGFGSWIPSQWTDMLACVLLLLPVVFGDPRRGRTRRVLSWRPLLWLGTVSYGIYLWHTTFLHMVGPSLVPDGRAVTLVLIIALSVVAAGLSYELVERPAQQLAKRLSARLDRRRVADVRSW